MTGWDAEYARAKAGMPSSWRGDPSGVVVWLVENWPRLDGPDGPPARGLDVGCGTARNTVFVARQGTEMRGFDSSAAAIETGRERVRAAGVDVELEVRDLRDGLPADDGELDLVLDVFVYKHQMQPSDRAAYRAELDRVLTPQGRVLISLAEPDDGYYASCPPFEDAGAGPHAVLDPEVGVGSVLFSLADLREEMAGAFELEMAWHKKKPGVMHGQTYLRKTLATIWRRG